MKKIFTTMVLLLLSMTFTNNCALLSDITDTSTTGTAPGLSYAGSPYSFVQNTAIATITPTLTGDAPTSCSPSTSLPAGLSIDATCAISGTPTTVQTATVYTLTASNDTGSGTADISIEVTVAGIAPTVSYTGSPYSFTQNTAITALTATLGGNTPTSCNSSPTLPAGLSIDATSCAISGTPTAVSSATVYTITATNATGNGTANISIAVTASAGAAPTVSYTGSPFTFTQNSAITTLTATLGGDAPTSCVSSPTLPSGLLINATTCAISGTPSAAQIATAYIITATNATGNGTANISIAVAAAGGGGSAMSGNKIAAGGAHTVAIKSDGTLWAWGYNGYGQLGDGTTVLTKNTPTQIGTGTTWSAIAAGEMHTIALRTDGTLWAWGWNNGGQLGNGTTVLTKNTPTQIGTGATWSAISAGSLHTVALKSDGTLWTWGENTYGQLGDGTTVNKNIPTQIGTGTTWSAISAGNIHTIALKSDGTLWAWGRNTQGQLGDGTTLAKNTPIQIGTGTTWSKVGAGSGHTLAIKTNGTLWAWGQNNFGQLGLGYTVNTTTPTQIGTGTTWSAIAAGQLHTIALKLDGTLWTCGDNTNGQLGDGTTAYKLTLTQITGNSWSAITAGNLGDHTIAIKSDGSLWSWGLNGNGQLGDGTTVNKNIPTQIVF